MSEKRSRSLVHAPYNFVPVSAKVHEVDWGDSVSCDVPFEDGISGSLEVELEVVTPLCVGGAHDQERRRVAPFRTLDNELAIPGTSIKGMLRNVVEIATFSKLQLVDRDRRYAVRDLSKPELYRNHMTRVDIDDRRRKVFKARSHTGWLVADGDRWRIVPCKMSRVEHEDLLDYLGEDAADDLQRAFQERGSMVEKYRAWRRADFELSFTPEAESLHRLQGRDGYLSFSRAIQLGEGNTKGRLVMTGQPGPRKHREFIFYGRDGEELGVPESVRRNFVLNHSEQQGQRRQGLDEPNEEWAYWYESLLEGKKVPVFFIEEAGVVQSFGLAQMYRLAYKHSVGEAIDNVSIDHHPNPGRYLAEKARDKGEAGRLRTIRPKIDFAETLFGYVRGYQGGEAARGRVDVGLFVLESGGKMTAPKTAVLNAPKPTYFPSYIDQRPILDDSGVKLRRGADYVTFMAEGCEIRGWKRYPARPKVADPPSPKGESNVATTWTAVAEGVFGGKIRFHNVRPAELGAVLWALDFGGRERLCHTLGYAKPFGYGNVRLRVRSNTLHRLVDGASPDLTAVREKFIDYMEAAIPEWKNTEQIVQLLAMADPDNEKKLDQDLSYMVLDHRSRRNEFLQAKGRAQGDARYVLPSYAEFHGDRDRDRFPRVDRKKAWEKRRLEMTPERIEGDD